MKVAKFGGSSVANADQIKKVAAIIQADKERKIIVVSAPGKRYETDEKTTDLLIELAETAGHNKIHQVPLTSLLSVICKLQMTLN